MTCATRKGRPRNAWNSFLLQRGTAAVFAVAALLSFKERDRVLAQQQQSTSCSNQELTARGNTESVRSALLKAAVCGAAAVVDVTWEGTIEVDEPFLVLADVELRITGSQVSSSGERPSSSSQDLSAVTGSSAGSNESNRSTTAASEGIEPSIILKSSDSTGLFSIERGASLYVSGITLRGGGQSSVAAPAATGEEGEGVGAVYTLGGDITSDGCLWESFRAEESAGAIFAKDGSNVTFLGDNTFSNCSTSGVGGGALVLKNATCTVDGDLSFEGCTAVDDGGAVDLFTSDLVLSSGSTADFRDCHAGDKGGGLYLKASTMSLGEAASISFSQCTSGSVSGGKGGGLCAFESTITVTADASMQFSKNAAPAGGDGGGMFGQMTNVSVAAGAQLSFTDNYAGDSGGGMRLEWSLDNDATDNAEMTRACLTLESGASASFSGNSAVQYGGGCDFAGGCEVSLDGDVSFTGNAGVRGGAIFMRDSTATLSGNATFVENSAERWGGGIMVMDSPDGIRLSGDVEFRGNAAGRSGGAVYSENAGVFFIPSGNPSEAVWSGNSAGYDGGVFAVDGGGLVVEGGWADSNSAAQRGGVIFATGESTVQWSGGESSNNSAASGGAMYISSSELNLTDVRLNGDHTSYGGVVFLAGANTRAVNTSIVAPSHLAGDFALHVDAGSTLSAFACRFENWKGDSPCVVSEGSVVMDSCDFSQSGAGALVRASQLAVVRNGVLGDVNYAYVGYNSSALLGVGTYTCDTLPADKACMVEDECVDAENGMGVLCPTFLAGATGQEISIAGTGFSSSSSSSTASARVELGASAATVEEGFEEDDDGAVYYPDLVVRELVITHPSAGDASAGDDGAPDSSTTVSTAVGGVGTITGAEGVLWELERANEDEGSSGNAVTAGSSGDVNGMSEGNFTWTAVPSSGILARGQSVTIRVVGTPPPPEDPEFPSAVYNGRVSAEFHVVSRSAGAESSATSESVALETMFYYCRTGSFWDGDRCESCAEMMASITEGSGALECTAPGLTLDTLPLAAGYWRGDVTRTFVRPCLYPEACVGGRGIFSSSPPYTTSAASRSYDENRYCEEGYRGPYCAVCADGYHRLSGLQCQSCGGRWGLGARAMMWCIIAVCPLALAGLVVFLVNGPEAVTKMKDKALRTCCCLTSGNAQRSVAFDDPHSEGKRAVTRWSRRKSKAKGFGARLLKAIPFQKLKILIVVWQILTQFSALAEIPYPKSYKSFLGKLDIFSFDISWPLTATCIIGEISFYQRLLAVTLGPLTALALLYLTYAVSMFVHRGSRRANVDARQCAVVRHASAALLVLFLVFSSVSTTVFSTFSCDHVEDLDEHLLRADYSISCDHSDHVFYKVYAMLMILVYPVGIPVMFMYLLLKRRDKINPPMLSPETNATICFTYASDSPPPRPKLRRASSSRSMSMAKTLSSPMDRDMNRLIVGTTSDAWPEASPRIRGIMRDEKVRAFTDIERERHASGCGPDSPGSGRGDAATEREQVLENRAQDPDLQPTIFLWEPYEPRNYYYETVECGRRCLLTGALVFVLPNTAGQVAGACIFAFVSLLTFELLRPHLSNTDAWMYRIGCIVIFFSNFLGLMAKADVSGEQAQSQEMFGIVLICVHAAMVVSIMFQAFISMQAASESRDDYVEALMKKPSHEALITSRQDSRSTHLDASGNTASDLRSDLKNDARNDAKNELDTGISDSHSGDNSIGKDEESRQERSVRSPMFMMSHGSLDKLGQAEWNGRVYPDGHRVGGDPSDTRGRRGSWRDVEMGAGYPFDTEGMGTARRALAIRSKMTRRSRSTSTGIGSGTSGHALFARGAKDACNLGEPHGARAVRLRNHDDNNDDGGVIDPGRGGARGSNVIAGTAVTSNAPEFVSGGGALQAAARTKNSRARTTTDSLGALRSYLVQGDGTDDDDRTDDGVRRGAARHNRHRQHRHAASWSSNPAVATAGLPNLAISPTAATFGGVSKGDMFKSSRSQNHQPELECKPVAWQAARAPHASVVEVFNKKNSGNDAAASAAMGLRAAAAPSVCPSEDDGQGSCY